MKKAAIAAVLALASVGAHADSIADYVHVELGAGVSRYSRMGDNIWVQDGMEHTTQLSAPVLSLGFTGPLFTREAWGIDWHVDYVSLGHISSQCDCTPVDANYNTGTHQLIAPLPVNVPNANFVGNGNAQGVALMIEPYVNYRKYRFGVSAGLFPYIPNWDITVYNWSVAPGAAPQTIHADTPHGIQWGKVVGASVSRGPFTLSYQHYFLPTRFDATHSPAIWKGADVVMLKYKF